MEKTGYCINRFYNGGPCPKCGPQNLQKADSSKFVCSVCGQPLHEAKPASKFKKEYVFFGLGAVLVGLALFFILRSSSNDSTGLEQNQSDTTGTTEKAELSVSITKTDLSSDGANDGTATASATGGTEPYTYQWSNGETGEKIFGLDEGTYTVTVRDAEDKTVEASVKIINSTQTQTQPQHNSQGDTTIVIIDPNNTIQLPYGIYVGDTKDGKPDGHGKLTYTESHVINDRDITKKDVKAAKGDYVKGYFEDGLPSSVDHYDSNGNLKSSYIFGK